MTEATPARRSRRRKLAKAPATGAATTLSEDELRSQFNAILTQLNGHFAQREAALKCMVVALLTGMNYLLVGPRGTGKTDMGKSLMKHVQGSRHFSTLLGSFTTVSDLVGRLNLAKLQQGVEERNVAGKTLDCDTLFYDEVMKGSDGVVNGLLGILSEDRDWEGQETDLWSAGSATNWPEVVRRSDRVAALFDRLHIKVPLERVSDRASRLKVMRASRTSYQADPANLITMEQVREAADHVRKVSIAPEIEELMCSVMERCLKEEIDISDRKLGQWQRALQACAWLDGRADVGVEDFWVVTFMAWENKADISKAESIVESCDRELVQELIKKVDKARQAYQLAKQNGLNAEKAGKVLDEIIQTAEHVSGAMKRYKLKPESKRDVGRAVKNLHKDFEALYSKFQPALDEEA